MELRSIPARYQTPAAALFVLLLGAAWLTGWGWKYQAITAVFDREALRSVAIATSIANSLALPEALLDADKARPSAPQGSPLPLAQLEQRVQRQALGQNVTKVQVFDHTGRIAYSSVRSEIGSLSDDAAVLNRVWRGEAVAVPVEDFVTGQSVSVGEALYVRALASVANGEMGHKGVVVAVFSSVTEAMVGAREEAHRIWAVASIAGLVVFGLALVILRRAEEAQRLKDAVTGLPRREVAVATATTRYKSQIGHPIGWMTVSLQRLRQVGAAYGHQAVDDIARQAAQRLEGLSSMEGKIFRLGGEAFAIPIEVAAGEDANAVGEKLAQQVFRLFELPCESGRHSVVMDLAIGLATGVAGQVEAEQLLSQAEVAMAEANRRGGNQWQMYVPGLEHAVRERLQSLGSLHEAAERRQFSLYYQPLVDAVSQQWVGCEALLRWKHPLKGVILPDNFVPLAEESGLIVEIGQFVLREACQQIAQWRQSLRADMTVSINLSARQFADPHLLDTVRSMLREYDLPPSALIFEVTETCLALDPDHAVDVLSELRHLGAAVAVDDFGVGYSSLSALRQLPVDILKIDRSFISRAPDDPVDASIAQAIAALAHGLHLTLVAEGVETTAQAALTQALGCDKLQGFLYARPLAPPEFESEYRVAPANAGQSGIDTP